MSDFAPPVFRRRAFARDDGDGKSTAEWTLTPSSLTDPVQVIAEPVVSVPVIFVPGIMGSNLKLTGDVDRKKKDAAVWLMDTTAGAAWAWVTQDAASRQRRLNPKNTAVYADGQVVSEIFGVGHADAIRERRFWGEVSAMSYGDLLVWLQRSLNDRGRVDLWRAGIGTPDFAAGIGEGMHFHPLTEAAVGHAANFRYPVYACGYNWLQSNSDAAETLAARIDKVIAANNSGSYHCDKVILVTHSMGGLVARACSELLGMRSKIAGIVHGVMPANGAAVAYRRVRSGTEGAAGLVIGNTAAKVTAVFANSPGALQLLPNKAYGSGWLKLGIGSATRTRVSVQLPQSYPYEEIYKQRGPWWALVREELINPGEVPGHKGWIDYLHNIQLASTFHGRLGSTYHPNTYAFHGDGRSDSGGMTWNSVGWHGYPGAPVIDPSVADLLALKPLEDGGEGKLSARRQDGLRYSFFVSGKDSTGDGTVPVVSGAAPAKAGVMASYRLDLKDEGHEGAYRVDEARRVTLHAILNIAQSVNVPI